MAGSVIYSAEVSVVDQGWFESLFEFLEEKIRRLKFSEMQSILEMLKIHPIMLDPLRSKTAQSDCMIVQFPGVPHVAVVQRRLSENGGDERLGQAGRPTRLAL